MPKYHLKVDWRNGDTVCVGKSGREVTGAALDALEVAAAGGDAEAALVLRDLDMSVDAEGRARSEDETLAASIALLDNCPECAAAREAEGRLIGELHGELQRRGAIGWERLDGLGGGGGTGGAHEADGFDGRGAGHRSSARMRAADGRARAMRRRKMTRASRVANRR